MDHSMWLLQELYIQLNTYEEQFSSYLVIGANKQHSERKLQTRMASGDQVSILPVTANPALKSKNNTSTVEFGSWNMHPGKTRR